VLLQVTSCRALVLLGTQAEDCFHMHRMQMCMLLPAMVTSIPASQAWFEATTRTDVTDGLRTRAEIADRAPHLAAFLLRVYGNNEWIYPDSAPKKLSGKVPKCARMPLANIVAQVNANSTAAARAAVGEPSQRVGPSATGPRPVEDAGANVAGLKQGLAHLGKQAAWRGWKCKVKKLWHER
jgi:hypothetical protein